MAGLALILRRRISELEIVSRLNQPSKKTAENEGRRRGREGFEDDAKQILALRFRSTKTS
jgi:hypothetical protein